MGTVSVIYFDKRQRKPKEESKMDNRDKLATLGAQ